MTLGTLRMLFVCGLVAGCGLSSGDDNDDLSRENDKLRRENEALKKKPRGPAELVARNDLLETENAQLHEQVEAAKKDVGRANEELSKKQSEVQVLSTNLTTLNQDIEAKKKRIEELTRILANDDGSLGTLATEHARLQEEVTRLEATRVDLSTRLEQAQASANDLSKKVSELERNLTTLQAERDRDTAALSGVRDLSRAVLRPYEGIWVAETDDAYALPSGCFLFLRVDREPVGFQRIVTCEDGRSQVDRFSLRGVDSRYHVESATNALRFRFTQTASSCTAGNATQPSATALYFLHFLDGFGEVMNSQSAVLGEGDAGHYFRYGSQLPELYRNSACPELQARAAGTDAKPILKMAAKACTLAVETSGNGCVEIP